MTATAHALVGGAIAASVPDPIIGLTLAAASHPLLDMIPHWDFGCGWRQKPKIQLFAEGVFDLSIGVLLTFLVFGAHVGSLYLLSCIFMSELWDLLETPYWFLNWDFFPFSSIYQLQSHIQSKASLPWGILNQVVTVGLIFVILGSIR